MFDVFIHKWLRVPYILHCYEYARPKKPHTTVLLLHGIGSSHAMWAKVASRLPKQTRIVAVDLLGFGSSPKPTWKAYSARRQADSLIATLLRANVRGPVVVVGHSLGSLVAVELAKRYRFSVRELILCSPPFYRPTQQSRTTMQPDYLLRSLYESMHNNPKRAKRILGLASKYHYLNAGFKVDDTNIASYLASLETAIVNQTSLHDAVRLKKPIHILNGRFDMLVIDKNLKYLQQNNPQVTVKHILAGHEIVGNYSNAVVELCSSVIARIPPRKRKSTL